MGNVRVKVVRQVGLGGGTIGYVGDVLDLPDQTATYLEQIGAVVPAPPEPAPAAPADAADTPPAPAPSPAGDAPPSDDPPAPAPASTPAPAAGRRGRS